MKRIAVYARVSTSTQTVDPQLDVLRDYADRRNLEITVEYVDQGVSGSASDRPAFVRMLADARRRRFDAIVCIKLDRLARSVRQLTSLAGDLDSLGIDLVVLDQAIDTSTPSGRLLFHVLGSIAEFERDLIRERTRAGMEAARRRGRKIGRPRATLDREALVSARSLGESVSALARRYGVSRATIRQRIGEQRVAEKVPSGSPVSH